MTGLQRLVQIWDATTGQVQAWEVAQQIADYIDEYRPELGYQATVLRSDLELRADDEWSLWPRVRSSYAGPGHSLMIRWGDFSVAAAEIQPRWDVGPARLLPGTLTGDPRGLFRHPRALPFRASEREALGSWLLCACQDFARHWRRARVQDEAAGRPWHA